MWADSILILPFITADDENTQDQQLALLSLADLRGWTRTIPPCPEVKFNPKA